MKETTEAEAMEEFTKEEIQEARENIQDLILKLMRDKIEYLDVKADFFEGQSIPIGELIYRMELRVEETLKEEQEVNDKLLEGAEVKKNLVSVLEGLKSQQKVEIRGKKDDEAVTRINGFFQCPECPYKTKSQRFHLKRHINAVHRKLKPWQCLICDKGKIISICLFRFFFLIYSQFQTFLQKLNYLHIF